MEQFDGEENVTMNETATGECFPNFNEDFKCDIILGIRRGIAVISMLSCIFIIAIIFLFKKYRFLSQRLILYLSIAAFFQALVYATGDFRISGRAARGIDTGFCMLQGYWTLFFDWFSFAWVLCISFNVFWSAIFLKKTEKFEKFYVIISIALPIIICCFPFIGLSYGPAGLWCWISSVRDDKIYTTGIIIQFVFFYGPLWFLSIVLLIILATVFVILHRRKRTSVGKVDANSETYQKIWEEEIRPVMLFPLIYIAILIFPAINRLRLAAGHKIHDSGANFFFWLMHSITLTLHGTIYVFLFACDKQTMSRIRWTHIKAAIVGRFKKSSKEYPVTENRQRESLHRKTKVIINKN